MRAETTHFVYSPALDAERVLVHFYYLPVLQYRLVLGPYGAQVDAHEQRRRQYGPDSELGLALLVRQTEIADDELRVYQKIHTVKYSLTPLENITSSCRFTNIFVKIIICKISLNGRHSTYLKKMVLPGMVEKVIKVGKGFSHHVTDKVT